MAHGERKELPRQPAPRTSSVIRVVRIVVLVLFTLVYLYVGLQVFFTSSLQGIFTLVATGALGLGTYRIYKGHKASPVVFWGTLPLFLLLIPYAIMDPGQITFLIASAAAPAISGAVGLFGY